MIVLCCSSSAESNCSSYDRLRYLFETRGDSNYIGEDVSIVEHSLQAAYFASTRSTDTELIIASLLHDIGHALGLEVEQDMVTTTLISTYHAVLVSFTCRTVAFTCRTVAFYVSLCCCILSHFVALLRVAPSLSLCCCILSHFVALLRVAPSLSRRTVALSHF